MLFRSNISFSIDNIANPLNLSWDIVDLRYDFINFNLVFIYIYIYILVSGNILNKSLFMQVKIIKNLLLFGKTITVLFI